MCSLGKNWMPPFFRHPAILPHPTRVEGEDSREYVEGIGELIQSSVLVEGAIVNKTLNS